MKLSVVIGTYNRLPQLKNCIDSVFNETSRSVKVYVTDAGSTDGTVEYLRSIASHKIIPVFVGERVGQAKAYNDVFKSVDTPYVSWLSDDHVLVNGGLDTAVEILEQNLSIGMVGLKIKDIRGPFADAPYIGGISSIGILNVNQGVLPTPVLKKTGGFDESFRDYGIDPDLTARVLFEGYKIVYSKKVALHHYRNWPIDRDSDEYKLIEEKQKRSLALYDQKYLNNRKSNRSIHLPKAAEKSVWFRIVSQWIKNKSLKRDLYNVINAHYISPFDLIRCIARKYYLVQSPPGSKQLMGTK